VGRHSAPGRGAFAVSLLSAAGRAVLVLALVAVVAAGTVLAANRLADRPVGALDPTVHAPAPVEETTERGAPLPSEELPSPAATVAGEQITAAPSSEVDVPPSEPPAAPVAGRTVQVLDAGGGSAAAGAAASVLEARGLEVVAVHVVRCCRASAVLHTDDDATAARAVADALGVAQVGPNGGVYASTVDLHVLVGQDWQP
jgi:hypothetical protein